MLVLVCLVLAAGCAGDAPRAGDPAAEPGAAPDGLDFALPALGGGQVVGAELAGRDVALWFWAPW